MKNNKYLIFIDIDGTLVEYGGRKIKPEILEEIKKLKTAGHIFVISTGRDLNSTLSIEGIENFDFLSVIFGSCIYQMPKQNLIYNAKSWSKDEILPLIQYICKNKIVWSYKDNLSHKAVQQKDEYIKKKENLKIVDENEFLEDLENSKIYQLWIKGYLSEEVENSFPHLNFFKMPNNYTDVTPKHSSKAQAVKFLSEKYPNMTTVSIGDSQNDFAMFDCTDISIAMGNATEDVKARTTLTTKTLEDNGLIYAFRNLLKM